MESDGTGFSSDATGRVTSLSASVSSSIKRGNRTFLILVIVPAA